MSFLYLYYSSGVKYLRLIDFDQVTLSSLNRHACATLEDVGIPKVIALKRFLHKVCPDRNFLDIDALPRMYTGTEKDGDMMDFPAGKVSGLQLDKANWDFIIDAIDDVPTKAKLLAHCIRNNIRVVSCMGAGGKSDVTRIHISDLRTACQDPLATKLRQTLKKSLKNDSSIKNESYMEDMDKVAVIYSSEKTVVKLVDFTPEQKEEGIHKFGAVDNMRIRVLPVLGTMPAIMGQSMAAMVLCELGGKPFSVRSYPMIMFCVQPIDIVLLIFSYRLTTSSSNIANEWRKNRKESETPVSFHVYLLKSMILSSSQ